MLLANNFIHKNDRYGYKITPNGEETLKLLEDSDKIKIDKGYFKIICNSFKEVDSKGILEYVYKEYGELLNNSLIIDGLTYEESDYEWIKSTKKDLWSA